MIYKETIERLEIKKYIEETGRIIFESVNSEILDEAFFIEEDKMAIMVRNKKDDRIKHHRSFKLKTSKILRDHPLGIPILFNKVQTNKDTVKWEWKIDPDAEISRKDAKKLITEKESAFIDKVLIYAGDDMLEYWKLDSKIPSEQRKIDELNKKYS